MSERDDYRQKMEAQIEEQRAKLDLLKARAKQAVADGKISARQEIEEAEGRLEALKAKLKEMNDAGEDAWQEMKDGCETAWQSFSEGCQKAMDKLK